jgi:MinD-like ATPase involved in chromosome partitioning or flagellar assembly
VESGTKQTTEIVAFGSGKGGTGKTIIASSLGYALIRSRQRVMMVDSDPATDGLSLFLLGPKGVSQTESFQVNETFSGVISRFSETGQLDFNPRSIHRSESGDHGVSYQAIISGRGLYGDLPESGELQTVPDLDRISFRKAVAALFAKLRNSGEYDYVLVDTRGGFAFESTDVCALADSFIVVTEPNFTSFYQDRNLVKRISAAAKEMETRPLLRSIIVNKATEAGLGGDGRLSLENLEASFRLELEREFPIKFKDTHAVPLDIEAIKAYKIQAIPYVAAPASPFSFATLSAFGEILQVVTSRWSTDQVSDWNRLIDAVSTALETRYKQIQQDKEETTARAAEVESARKQAAEYKQRAADVERELVRVEAQYQREIARTQVLFSPKERSERSDKEILTQLTLWQRFRKLRLWRQLIFFYLVFAMVATPAYLGWRWYRQAHFESILTAVYSPTVPPALRIMYFDELVYRYHQRNFDSLNLPGIHLENTSLPGMSFRGATLANASFLQSQLGHADFSNADLSGAQFRNADLRSAVLTGAKLKAANLVGANLGDADLRDADLSQADLSRASVSLDQLAEGFTDATTILPNGKPGPLHKHPLP